MKANALESSPSIFSGIARKKPANPKERQTIAAALITNSPSVFPRQTRARSRPKSSANDLLINPFLRSLGASPHRSSSLCRKARRVQQEQVRSRARARWFMRGVISREIGTFEILPSVAAVLSPAAPAALLFNCRPSSAGWNADGEQVAGRLLDFTLDERAVILDGRKSFSDAECFSRMNRRVYD